jgi:hemerythrin-like domain-containing protein
MSTPSEAPRAGDLLPFLRSHECMRSDVDRMRGALTRCRLDDAQRAAFATYWRNFAGILDHHHHYEDETVIPRLLEKAEAHRPVCDRATAEHRRLDTLLGRMSELIDGFGSGSVAQDPVVRIVSEIDCVLGGHLDHEEEFMVPVFLCAFSRDEWMSMEGQNITALRDRGLLPFALPWTHHGLYPGLLRVALAGLPEVERGQYYGRWLPRYQELCGELWSGAAAPSRLREPR